MVDAGGIPLVRDCETVGAIGARSGSAGQDQRIYDRVGGPPVGGL